MAHQHHHVFLDPGPVLEQMLARFLPVLRSINRKLDSIMATNAELQASLDKIEANLDEASTELTKDIADLTAALAAAGGTTPEVDAVVARLDAKSRALADIVATATP